MEALVKDKREIFSLFYPNNIPNYILDNINRTIKIDNTRNIDEYIDEQGNIWKSKHLFHNINDGNIITYSVNSNSSIEFIKNKFMYILLEIEMPFSDYIIWTDTELKVSYSKYYIPNNTSNYIYQKDIYISHINNYLNENKFIIYTNHNVIILKVHDENSAFLRAGIVDLEKIINSSK